MTTDTSDLSPVRWHLVIPVKDASTAKSRLQAPAPLARSALARAVARDTVEAACEAVGPACVTVVTSDEVVAAASTGLGAGVVADPGRGLNDAVASGWDRPTSAGGGRLGWAALLGDLPALTADDLSEALRVCAGHRQAVVPDAEGTGTVLLTSTVSPPSPRFGTGSAGRHAADATVLALDLPRLRRDVDTVEDLRRAVALGVGRHTLLVLGQGA